MTITPKQELFVWVAAVPLAFAVWVNSHTFYVTTVTYGYGTVFLLLMAVLFWMRFRKRQINPPRWLRFTSNAALTVIGMFFLMYLLGVATYYE